MKRSKASFNKEFFYNKFLYNKPLKQVLFARRIGANILISNNHISIKDLCVLPVGVSCFDRLSVCARFAGGAFERTGMRKRSSAGIVGARERPLRGVSALRRPAPAFSPLYSRLPPWSALRSSSRGARNE